MRRLRDLLFVASEAPDDDRDRGAAARGTVAVAGAAFCLSVACAFTMPILFGSDERVHLAYVEVLLSAELPEVDTDVPLDGRLRVLREYFPNGTASAGPRGDIWVANHPPLSYAVAAPAAWLSATLGYDKGPPMILRLLCGLFMSVGVVATAAVSDALLPGRRRTAVLAAGVAAFTPGLVAISSYGYNDGAALAAGTALLAVVLRVARFGPTNGRFVATVVLGALAVLVRTALLPLVPLAAVVWLVRSMRTDVARSMAGAAVIVIVPAIAGGWFYLRNIHLYGDVSGSSYLQTKFGRSSGSSTAELLRHPRFLVGAWQDLWGSFRARVSIGSGQIEVGSPDAKIGSRLLIGGSLVGLAGMGWLRALASRRHGTREGWCAWLVALGWTAVCVVGIASFVSGGGSPHPRYLLPAHAVLVVVLVAGISRLPGRRITLPGVLLGLVAVDLMLFTRLATYVARVPFPERFSQPPASAVVVLLALAAGLAAGLIAAGAYREIDDL